MRFVLNTLCIQRLNNALTVHYSLSVHDLLNPPPSPASHTPSHPGPSRHNHPNRFTLLAQMECFGSCFSSSTDSSKPQKSSSSKSRSKAAKINQLIEEERLRLRNQTKILLLGPGESGKSTILKQMKDELLNCKTFKENQIVYSTISQAESLTRKWKLSKEVQGISLFSCRDVHTLGSASGPAYEALLARVKIISQSSKARILLSSFPLDNYKDVCAWLDITLHFHFSLSCCRGHLEIVPYSLTDSPENQIISLAKMTLSKVKFAQSKQTSLLIVPNKKMMRIVVKEFLNACLLNDIEAVHNVSNCSEQDLLKNECRAFGIGLMDESSEEFKNFYPDSFTDFSSNSNSLNLYSCLIATKEVAMERLCTTVDIVAIQGTEYFDSSQMSFVDYSLLDFPNCSVQKRMFCFSSCTKRTITLQIPL